MYSRNRISKLKKRKNPYDYDDPDFWLSYYEYPFRRRKLYKNNEFRDFTFKKPQKKEKKKEKVPPLNQSSQQQIMESVRNYLRSIGEEDYNTVNINPENYINPNIVPLPTVETWNALTYLNEVYQQAKPYIQAANSFLGAAYPKHTEKYAEKKKRDKNLKSDF